MMRLRQRNKRVGPAVSAILASVRHRVHMR